MSLIYRHTYLTECYNFSVPPVRKDIGFLNDNLKIQWIFLFSLRIPSMTLERSLLFNMFPSSGFDD